MKSTSNNCYRRGLTLIEVVAGLALMGTLLAAMLTAKGRFTRQRHYAQRVLAAVDAADALLAARWNPAEPGGGFDDGKDGVSGTIEGNDTFTWRTVEINDDHAASLRSRIVRLEVFDTQNDPRGLPLVSVDLLLPKLSGVPGVLDQRPEIGNVSGTEESIPSTEPVS